MKFAAGTVIGESALVAGFHFAAASRGITLPTSRGLLTAKLFQLNANNSG